MRGDEEVYRDMNSTVSNTTELSGMEGIIAVYNTTTPPPPTPSQETPGQKIIFAYDTPKRLGPKKKSTLDIM